MTILQKILGIGFILSLAGAYIAGQKSVSIDKTKTDTTTTDNKHTTIIVVKKPDGSSTTTETIDEKSKSKTDAVTQIPVVNKQKTNISAIIAEDLKNKAVPAYGLSFTKEFIGPLTLGAFGLTNGIIGLSIGINF